LAPELGDDRVTEPPSLDGLGDSARGAGAGDESRGTATLPPPEPLRDPPDDPESPPPRRLPWAADTVGTASAAATRTADRNERGFVMVVLQNVVLFRYYALCNSTATRP
jgi:hypothetical protein